MSTSTLQGFPEGTVAFLGTITVNNYREWFEAHRQTTSGTTWNLPWLSWRP